MSTVRVFFSFSFMSRTILLRFWVYLDPSFSLTWQGIDVWTVRSHLDQDPRRFPVLLCDLDPRPPQSPSPSTDEQWRQKRSVSIQVPIFRPWNTSPFSRGPVSHYETTETRKSRGLYCVVVYSVIKIMSHSGQGPITDSRSGTFSRRWSLPH